MEQPIEVTEAVLADALGHRYGVLPSVILEQDASLLAIFNTAAQMNNIEQSESTDG
jgi:hypothetical protein